MAALLQGKKKNLTSLNTGIPLLSPLVGPVCSSILSLWVCVCVSRVSPLFNAQPSLYNSFLHLKKLQICCFFSLSFENDSRMTPSGMWFCLSFYKWDFSVEFGKNTFYLMTNFTLGYLFFLVENFSMHFLKPLIHLCYVFYAINWMKSTFYLFGIFDQNIKAASSLWFWISLKDELKSKSGTHICLYNCSGAAWWNGCQHCYLCARRSWVGILALGLSAEFPCFPLNVCHLDHPYTVQTHGC